MDANSPHRVLSLFFSLRSIAITIVWSVTALSFRVRRRRDHASVTPTRRLRDAIRAPPRTTAPHHRARATPPPNRAAPTRARLAKPQNHHRAIVVVADLYATPRRAPPSASTHDHGIHGIYPWYPSILPTRRIASRHAHHDDELLRTRARQRDVQRRPCACSRRACDSSRTFGTPHPHDHPHNHTHIGHSRTYICVVYTPYSTPL